MGGTLACRGFTSRPLAGGECVDVSCMWDSPPHMDPTTLYIRADDGNAIRECLEANNLGTIADVVCRPPG
jgi:hypothetical protein